MAELAQWLSGAEAIKRLYPQEPEVVAICKLVDRMADGLAHGRADIAIVSGQRRENWDIPKAMWDGSYGRNSTGDDHWWPKILSGEVELETGSGRDRRRARLYGVRFWIDPSRPPSAPPAALASARSMASAEAKAVTWLRSRFADPATLTLAKPVFLSAAQKEISGLSERAFNAAWAEAAKDYPERTLKGRKPQEK